MYLRFGNNPSNIWEIIPSADKKKITAIYRGRVANPTQPIEDVSHDERSYRLWKMFSVQDNGYEHMPDVLPLIMHMSQNGYEIATKIRDSKYLFTKI